MCACACDWVCTWRLEVDVRIILDYPSTIFTESRISQSSPELAAVVSLNSLLDPGDPLSPLLKAGIAVEPLYPCSLNFQFK